METEPAKIFTPKSYSHSPSGPSDAEILGQNLPSIACVTLKVKRERCHFSLCWVTSEPELIWIESQFKWQCKFRKISYLTFFHIRLNQVWILGQRADFFSVQVMDCNHKYVGQKKIRVRLLDEVAIYPCM
jgi:hypothetical protein